MKGVAGLVVFVWCAVMIACASAKRADIAPPQQSSGRQGPMPGSPEEQQISALWDQLEADRQRLDLPAPRQPFTCTGADCASAAQAMAAGVKTPTQVCRPASTETCTQSCTLADSICDNARKICEVAGKLDGDEWAAKKCSDGTSTCDVAKTRCCDCQK